MQEEIISKEKTETQTDQASPAPVQTGDLFQLTPIRIEEVAIDGICGVY